MSPYFKCLVAGLGAGSALCLAQPSLAQTLPYGDLGGPAADAGSTDPAEPALAPRRPGGKVQITPYIEAQQVLFAELAPGNDVVTYSVLAAGVDAAIAGRNNQASLSVRYERRFGWGKAGDSDALSGVARASIALVPQTLKLEAGGLAARTSSENIGASSSRLDFADNLSQVYSVYAGPQLATRLGDLAVNGAYRAGYTRLEAPGAALAGTPRADLFDESITHNASLRAGFQPGDVLPIGVGVGATYNREDISNLDQRVEDRAVRADVTVPASLGLQLVAGVGYEKVQVSARDAVRDPVTGAPVVGSDGRFVTDEGAARKLSYDVEGLTWDAGVVWRPSRRTSLSATVGRRYGSTTYTGSFAYAPNSRSSFNIAVYDAISGLGGQLTSALSALPTGFEAVRNPISGTIGNCVAASGGLGAGEGACPSAALGSVRSSVFRGRGVTANYAVTGGRFQTGIGAGYDRRKFIAAPGTVLAAANGVVDENIWLVAFFNGRIDRRSSFATSIYGNLYESGDASSGDQAGIGATAAYYRQLTSKLTASAAVGVDGVKREALADLWSSQAMVGLRYSF